MGLKIGADIIAAEDLNVIAKVQIYLVVDRANCIINSYTEL